MVLPDGVLNQLRERDRLRVQQLLEVEDAEVLQIVRGENRVLGGVMEALRKMASEAQTSTDELRTSALSFHCCHCRQLP